MSKTRVMVEINPENGQVLRIFRRDKSAFALDPEHVREMPRSVAVGIIRHTIFERSKGRCEYCGRSVSENSWPNKGEMHEQVPKSRGGEVSTFNGVFLCRFCHTNDEKAHGNRRLHFGESNVQVG